MISSTVSAPRATQDLVMPASSTTGTSQTWPSAHGLRYWGHHARLGQVEMVQQAEDVVGEPFERHGRVRRIQRQSHDLV